MPADDIQRITIDSIEQWNMVQASIDQAIQSQLAEATTDEASKKALLAHLLDWRDRMFKLAASNIRVDGQNLENFDHHLGQFDEALSRRLTALREQSFVTDQTVAERRRTVPTQIGNLLSDLLQRQRDAEEPIVDNDEDMATEEQYSFVARNAELQDQDAANHGLAQELNHAVPILTQRAQWVQEAAVETAKNRA